MERSEKMKTEWQVIEDYIEYMGDRDFVEKLTFEEQVLYKCQVKDTLSFTIFALRSRIAEFIDILFKKE